MAIIRVQNLVKEYRRPRVPDGRFATIRALFTHQFDVTRAVDDITFSIEEGELCGCIGANGAGKSTTIKLLTGILRPTSGRVEVAGVIPQRHREQNAMNIGLVFGQRSQLWWDLPLIESLILIAKMYQVPPASSRRNLQSLCELLDLDPFLRTPVRQLSLGQRMRGDLAASMIYEPRVLYLDEPTVGLDALAKERIRGFIGEINRERRTTVILTTHDLDDVEKLCNRVLLIDRGRIVYDGSVQRLKALHAPRHVLSVQLGSPQTVDVSHLRCDIEVIVEPAGKLRLLFDPTQIRLADLVSDMVSLYRVVDVAIEEPDLESVVRGIYEGTNTGERNAAAF